MFPYSSFYVAFTALKSRAIRRADEDDNPDTTQDADWSTLIPTPPFPAYAGNMASIGTSQSATFALFFGRDDIPFQNTWEDGPGGAGGATRLYAGFTALADEEANSRLYGGIHFRFDNAASYIFMNSMIARRYVQ